MSFTFSSIMAGFVFSVMGLYVLKRGRSQADLRWIGIGFALLAYTYFFSNPFLLWGIGIGLLGLAYATR